jgi:hypothetical protein
MLVVIVVRPNGNPIITYLPLMRPTNCLNCGSSLGITQQFCATCGQKAETHRLSLHEIGHDALHHLTHADKSIVTLLRQLAVRPGVVAREYVAGKRVKYFKPVNFFLIVGGILVFMTTYFHLANDTAIKKIEHTAAQAKDPAERKLLYAQVERTATTTHYMSKYANVMNMLVTPLFAFILWLFYRKAGYSFIEHLVANMYIISFIMLCYSLLVIPWQKLLAMDITGWIFLIAFIIFQAIYGAVAYYQFINKKGASQFLKALGAYLLAMILWTVGVSWLVYLYIRTGFL